MSVTKHFPALILAFIVKDVVFMPGRFTASGSVTKNLLSF
jgi:hypothetical protein